MRAEWQILVLCKLAYLYVVIFFPVIIFVVAAMANLCAGLGEKADIKEKQAWQMLLRKHEAEKMSESRQEEQQKMDDRMLRENYFIR